MTDVCVGNCGCSCSVKKSNSESVSIDSCCAICCCKRHCLKCNGRALDLNFLYHVVNVVLNVKVEYLGSVCSGKAGNCDCDLNATKLTVAYNLLTMCCKLKVERTEELVVVVSVTEMLNELLLIGNVLSLFFVVVKLCESCGCVNVSNLITGCVNYYGICLNSLFDLACRASVCRNAQRKNRKNKSCENQKGYDLFHCFCLLLRKFIIKNYSHNCDFTSFATTKYLLVEFFRQVESVMILSLSASIS